MITWEEGLVLLGKDRADAMRACRQDPFWHAEGDVLLHTEAVFHEVTKICTEQGLDEPTSRILQLSAVFHDIAKPLTAKEEDGRIRNHGHSTKGAVDTRIALWNLGVPFETREEICAIIANHQKPFHLAAGEAQASIRSMRKISFECKVSNLYWFSLADARGRRTIPEEDNLGSIDNIEMFKMIAEDQGCFTEPFKMANDYTKFRYFLDKPDIDPSFPLFQERSFPVYVMAGLPASGKSTFTKASGLPVISFDEAKAKGLSATDVKEEAKALLRKETSFVWDATHLTRQMREKALTLIANYGGHPIVKYMEVTPAVLFKRNTERDSTLSNAKIKDMLFSWDIPKRWEAPEVQYSPINTRDGDDHERGR